MPMQRWMAKAAGGTSQRLKPGLAMMRSLDRNAGWPTLRPSAVMLVLILYPPIISMVRQPLFTHSLYARRHDRFLGETRLGAMFSRRRTDEPAEVTICS